MSLPKRDGVHGRYYLTISRILTLRCWWKRISAFRVC